MVSDVLIDLMNTTGLEGTARRCVQCGDIIDAVILKHRSHHKQLKMTQPAPASVHGAVELFQLH